MMVMIRDVLFCWMTDKISKNTQKLILRYNGRTETTVILAKQIIESLEVTHHQN